MKKVVTAVIIVFACFIAQAQRIGINNINPDASTALMIDTAATGPRGILIPRMALSRRNSITSPATGLLIYQTDNTPGFYYNAGSPVTPNWQLVGGQPLANGNNAGQVYLTGNAPYGPNVPQTVTGDITLSSAAVATITTSAVTTAKVADGAITGSKIASGAVGNNQIVNNSVSISKINASGTPSASTYLRSDGSWAASASSAGIALIANLSVGQTLTPGGSAVAPSTVNFNNVQSSNTGLGTFVNSNTFNVTSSGIYLITATVASTSNFVLAPIIYVNGSPVAYGSGAANGFFPAPSSRSAVTAVLPLSEGNTIQVRVSPATQTTSVALSTDGSTKVTITKL